MNYKTKFTLLGLPLVHIATSGMVNGRPKRSIAKGWIAIGDISFGIIFSAGAFAFGGIAVGGVTVGVLSFAGLAIGVLAVGGAAIGVLASGGIGIAWYAADGGFAMANEFARGGKAIANHANDLVADDFFKSNVFFTLSRVIADHSRWAILIVFIPVIQNLIYKWKQRGSK